MYLFNFNFIVFNKNKFFIVLASFCLFFGENVILKAGEFGSPHKKCFQDLKSSFPIAAQEHLEFQQLTIKSKRDVKNLVWRLLLSYKQIFLDGSGLCFWLDLIEKTRILSFSMNDSFWICEIAFNSDQMQQKLFFRYYLEKNELEWNFSDPADESLWKSLFNKKEFNNFKIFLINIKIGDCLICLEEVKLGSYARPLCCGIVKKGELSELSEQEIFGHGMYCHLKCQMIWALKHPSCPLCRK